MIATQTLADLIRAGELDDYQARMPSTEVGRLDAAMVEARPCTHCGGPIQYRPFIRRDWDGDLLSYRAFAVCLKCEAAEEF